MMPFMSRYKLSKGMAGRGMDRWIKTRIEGKSRNGSNFAEFNVRRDFADFRTEFWNPTRIDEINHKKTHP